MKEEIRLAIILLLIMAVLFVLALFRSDKWQENQPVRTKQCFQNCEERFGKIGLSLDNYELYNDCLEDCRE